MKVGSSHLTYCTSIHPGDTWPEIRGNLERYLPLVKRRVCPDRPFGVGLRLSAAAAESLSVPEARDAFARFLREHECYVFTINGFPYGPFHGRPVKEEVYLPDWRDEARLKYSNQLADLLAFLLPAGTREPGSISTAPGAFKPNATTSEAVARIVDQFVRHVAHLIGVERRTGRWIALAIEPEPCCLLETIEETVAFFSDHLYSKRAAEKLASLAELGVDAAERALRRHLGVCLDLCHAAVEFEDIRGCVRSLADAGIQIAKVQVTAGLRIPRVTPDRIEALQKLDETVYLHQVVERSEGELRRYVDIGDACASAPWRSGDSEWRVHFHVPLFVEQLEGFESTQRFVREALALHKEKPLSPHLEVETYTWAILPAHVREIPVEDAIARELQWVRGALA